MIVRCDAGNGAQQSGAALVVTLTLVGAIALLCTAAMQEVVIDTAMTRHIATGTHARLAAVSAIEMTLADTPLPFNGELQRSLRVGPDEQFDATVTIVFLGALAAPPDDPTQVMQRFFDVTADVTGPRGATHRRRILLDVADAASPAAR